MTDDNGAQQELVNLPLVKFVGMSFEGSAIEDRLLGDDVEFVVRGRIVARTEELLANGARRQLRKVKVDEVIVK